MGRGAMVRWAVAPLVVASVWAGAVGLSSPGAGASTAPWTVVPTPNAPAATYSALQAVACPAPGLCIAVGSSSTPAGGPAAPLAEIGNGSDWSQEKVPPPTTASAGATLQGVSCPSASVCVAVGTYSSAQGPPRPLVERWDGSAWSLTSTAGMPDGVLTSVACATATRCEAVGQEVGPPTSLTTPPVADAWNGSAWTTQPVPVGAGYSYGHLSSVSCPAVTSCMAVGAAGGPHTGPTGAGGSQGLEEKWNGATWETTGPLALPPATANGSLTGVALGSVACPVVTWCMGVGTYSATGQAVPFAETWSGSGWSLPKTGANPGAMTFADGLTCTSVTSCVVVGTHGTDAAADRWNGTFWDFQGTALLQPSNVLDSVSCNVSCVAVGNYATNVGANTLVEAAGAVLSSPGYRLVAADGGVFAFGAPFYGSMGGKPLNAPVVGMAAARTGQGYWLVAADGGVFAFGVPFSGSMGGKPLDAPVVGMAAGEAAATGQGYWLVAADGGVFAFGVPFLGSRVTPPLPAPAVGMATDPTVGGYWVVTARGTVGAGAQVPWRTVGGLALVAPVVAVADDPGTGGYWLVAADGGVFAFDAPYSGSMGGHPLVAPIVGAAAAAA